MFEIIMYDLISCRCICYIYGCTAVQFGKKCSHLPFDLQICAYANNQHDLGAEIDVPLAESSFARAMKISKGALCFATEDLFSFFPIARHGVSHRC